jgi:hypothetical protein
MADIDFIEVYPNIVSKEFCEDLMNHFDYVESQTSLTVKRNTQTVKDTQFFFGDTSAKEDDIFELRGLHRRFSDEFFQACKKASEMYVQKYDGLKTIGRHTIYDLKVQKTRPGEGFTAWHFESAGAPVSRRFLTYMLYLNDIEEGGTTDFLYQQKTFKPTQGTMVVWPAGFTHMHRGNKPLKENKYIITTWMEFVD